MQLMTIIIHLIKWTLIKLLLINVINSLWLFDSIASFYFYDCFSKNENITIIFTYILWF